MNENEIMVSEYHSTTCAEVLESQSTVSGQTDENDDSPSSDSSDHLLSRFPNENLEISPSNNLGSSEKKEDNTWVTIGTIMQPAIGIKPEPAQKVVQQEIVDMYLKSMKQFTEALAKMKLPMYKGNGSPDSGGSHGTVILKRVKRGGSEP